MTATAFAYTSIDDNATAIEPPAPVVPGVTGELSPATALQRRIEESILAGFFDKQPVRARSKSRRAMAMALALPFVAWGAALAILALVGR